MDAVSTSDITSLKLFNSIIITCIEFTMWMKSSDWLEKYLNIKIFLENPQKCREKYLNIKIFLENP